MFSLISLLKELFHWLRVRQEIEARSLLRKELERVDDEAETLDQDVLRARSSGMPEYADRLLERKTDLLRYRLGLYRAGERSDLRSASEDGTGDGELSTKEG